MNAKYAFHIRNSRKIISESTVSKSHNQILYLQYPHGTQNIYVIKISFLSYLDRNYVRRYNFAFDTYLIVAPKQALLLLPVSFAPLCQKHKWKPHNMKSTSPVEFICSLSLLVSECLKTGEIFFFKFLIGNICQLPVCQR